MWPILALFYGWCDSLALPSIVLSELPFKALTALHAGAIKSMAWSMVLDYQSTAEVLKFLATIQGTDCQCISSPKGSIGTIARK